MNARAAARAVLVGLLLTACGTAPATAATNAVPPLPDIRHGHCIVRLPGGLLCVGGFARGGTALEHSQRQALWLADDDTQWRPRADMPTERAFFACATIGGAAYAIADGIDRYDAAADRWTEVIAPAPLPHSHFAACAHDGGLYVLGGLPLERAGLRRVDVATQVVTDVAPPPGFAPGDHFHLLVSLAGELHAIGGLDGESFAPQHEHHVLRDGAWVTLPPPPVGIWTKFAAHAVHDGKLYVFGEFGGFCLDPAAGTWTPRAALPELLAMPATVSRGDSLWVIGGMAVAAPRIVLLRYDVATDEWTSSSCRPTTPRAGANLGTGAK